MKDKVILVEMLLEKLEQYGKTNFELYKLQAIDKSTDVFASITTRVVLVSLIALFFFLITIGLSLYLGDLLGKTYYGFFAMAGIYLFFIILFVIIKKPLEEIFNNYLINQIFKEKKNASN
jgi:uncharacterized membrane protein